MSTNLIRKTGVEVLIWVARDPQGIYTNAADGATTDKKGKGRVGHAAVKIYPSEQDKNTYSSLIARGKDHVYVSLWPVKTDKKEDNKSDKDGVFHTYEQDLDAKEGEGERPNAIIRLNQLNVPKMLSELSKVINTPNWTLVSHGAATLEDAQSCSGIVHKLLEIGGIYDLAVYKNFARYEGPKDTNFYKQTNSHLGDILNGFFNAFALRALAISPKLVLHIAASAAEGNPNDKQDTLTLMNSSLVHQGTETQVSKTLPFNNSTKPVALVPGEDDFQKALSYRNKSPQNFQLMFQHFQAAANKGHPAGLGEVGRCYYFGTGVGRDHREAVRWYRQGADKGDPESQYNLGVCYSLGEGIAQDKQEAIRWWKLAAAQGNGGAINTLAHLPQ